VAESEEPLRNEGIKWSEAAIRAANVLRIEASGHSRASARGRAVTEEHGGRQASRGPRDLALLLPLELR
jgi:hypothetical protein